MASSLKKLSRKAIHAKDIFRTIPLLRQTPDPGAALVCSAMVDRQLELAILRRMVRLNKTQRRELFIGMAPMSSLSSKIKVAYALRIIGRGAVADLNIIREIRNQFAHSFHPITFKTRSVAAHCKKLKTPEKIPMLGMTLHEQPVITPRYRYIYSCWAIAIGLGGKGIRSRPKLAKGLFARTVLR